MTESDWLECANPERMLDFLGADATSRKVSLFVAAACRDEWARRGVERVSKALDVLERYFDLQVVEADKLIQAFLGFHGSCTRVHTSHQRDQVDDPYPFSHVLSVPETRFSGEVTYLRAIHAVQELRRGIPDARIARSRQAELMREVFGNPFRPVAIDESCLVWNGAAVSNIAQSVYTSSDFEGLSILADALEEAGCTDAGVIQHCRTPGLHVRGCWVIDAVLGNGCPAS